MPVAEPRGVSVGEQSKKLKVLPGWWDTPRSRSGRGQRRSVPVKAGSV